MKALEYKVKQLKGKNRSASQIIVRLKREIRTLELKLRVEKTTKALEMIEFEIKNDSEKIRLVEELESKTMNLLTQ